MTTLNKKQLSSASLNIIKSKPDNWAMLLFGQALSDLLDDNRIDIEDNLKTIATHAAGHPDFINHSEISDQVDIVKFHLHEISKVISEVDGISLGKDSVLGRACAHNDHESIIEFAQKWANNYYHVALHGEICRIRKTAYEEYFKKNVTTDATWVLIGSITIIKGYEFIYEVAINMINFFNNIPIYLKAKFGPDSTKNSSLKQLSVEKTDNSEIFKKLIELTNDLINIKENRKKSKKPIFRFDNLKNISEATSGSKSKNTKINDSPIKILNWMLDKETFSMSELGKKLMHLDLFPSAFINDINEKSMDETGELALEEKNNTVLVRTKLLNQVIASWG